MPFTRAFLKANGLNDDQIASVMEEHTSVVDALKQQRDAFKADAEKLPQVQKELDDLKNGEDFKAKFEKEHADFEQYKADIAKAEQTEKVKAAYRKLLQDEHINEKHVDSILGITNFDGLKLNKDGGLENVDALKQTIADKYSDFVVKTNQKAHQPATPPTNDNGGETSSIRQMAAKWHDAKYGKAQTSQT
jgi:uncharacterized protein YabN with tetrapyrrole methylase and pyrophosphatase domain